jgi:large subunit ribosomal protein L24
MRRKCNPIPKLHIRKGDRVKVLSGSADIKGKIGEVRIVDPVKMTAIVEGVNIITKHIRRSQDAPNGTISRTEAPIHISKLQVIDPKSGKPTRIGRTKNETGWVRVAKRSGEVLPTDSGRRGR